MSAADIRRLEDLSRIIVVMSIEEDATVVDDRVEVDVDLLGYDDEATVAEVCGGLRAPFGLPRAGELWIGAVAGQGLNDAYAMLPLTRFDSDDLPIQDPDVAFWTPPIGEQIEVLAREAGVNIKADEAFTSTSKTLKFNVGGLALEFTAAGKVKLGNATADVVGILDQGLGFIEDTMRDLTATQVVTLLGPQPLLTAPLFATRQAQVIAARVILKTIKA